MTAPTPDPVRDHLLGFFAGHDWQERVWPHGPARVELPDLVVLEFGPGRRSGLWVYTSAGAWVAHPNPRLEFVLAVPAPTPRAVELLFMTAWYHAHHRLGTGHTLPVGEQWLPGSACDHLLVSKPYPFGPDLEICPLPGGHAQVLWLLPITLAERDYKMQYGLEGLEQRFENGRLEFWQVGRSSMV